MRLSVNSPLLFLLLVWTSTGPALSGEDVGSVAMLSYSEYIDPAIPKQFTAATGIPVRIDTYESQDEMVAKLQAGAASQYDLVVATDVLVPGLIKLGLVQPLEQAAIPNAGNVAARFRNPDFDPGNRFSYPYQWGTVGLLFQTKKVHAPVSWALVLDPARQPGPVVLMDEMRTMLAIALRYQHHHGSTHDRQELASAGDLLIAAKGGSNCLGFAGGVDGMNKVLSGEAVAAVVYNGDAVKNMPKDGSVAFAVPVEGSGVWADVMLITSKAPHAHAGNLFINYLLGAGCGAQLSNFNHYATPNAAAMPLILPEDRANLAIYPSEAVMKTLEVQEDVGKDTRLYDEIWTRIKSR